MVRMVMTTMAIALMLVAGLVTSSLTNVALKKPAAQSSSSAKHPLRTADKAVDGYHGTRVEDCQHTDNGIDNTDPKHWVLIDLQGFYEIFSVQITNRGDAYQRDRLRDFDIEVFLLNPMNATITKTHNCYHYSGPMGSGQTELLQCIQPIIGRYVRIIMTNTGAPLHVCEVEVMARTPVVASRMFVRTEGHKAGGNLMWEVTSRSILECLMRCSSDVSCSAVNMGPKTWTSTGWSTVCQLLSFGGIGQPDSTTPDPDWDFYSIGDL